MLNRLLDVLLGPPKGIPVDEITRETRKATWALPDGCEEQVVRLLGERFGTSGAGGEMRVVECRRGSLIEAQDLAARYPDGEVSGTVCLVHDWNIGTPGEQPPTMIVWGVLDRPAAVWINGDDIVAMVVRDGETVVKVLAGDASSTVSETPSPDQAGKAMQQSITDLFDRLKSLYASTWYSHAHGPSFLDDGNAVIVRFGSRFQPPLVDNPHGPAIISGNGHVLYYRMGKRVDDEISPRPGIEAHPGMSTLAPYRIM